MSCCGQSSAQAQANVGALIDEGAAAGVLVKLVYVGADKRTQPFVVEGKIYQFGDNARRRVNAVSARVAPTFLKGPWAALFVLYDPALHDEDGLLLNGDPLVIPTTVKAVGKAKGPK